MLLVSHNRSKYPPYTSTEAN